MKKNLRKTTLIALAAGIIAAPVIYYFVSRRKKAGEEDEDDFAPTPKAKGLFSAYRGEHKPHHRKANNNGHLN